MFSFICYSCLCCFLLSNSHQIYLIFIYQLKRKTWGKRRRNVPDEPTPDVVAIGTRINDLWNIDGHKINSENWIGFTRFRILNKRPHQGHPWVDGRLTKTQVTSRPEMIWPDVWSSMSKCAQKKAMHHWDMDKSKIQIACHKKKVHDILPDEIDVIVQVRSLRFQWHQQCHALNNYASPPPRRRRRKLQCQTSGGRRPQHATKGDSL